MSFYKQNNNIRYGKKPKVSNSYEYWFRYNKILNHKIVIFRFNIQFLQNLKNNYLSAIYVFFKFLGFCKKTVYEKNCMYLPI